MDKTEIEKMPTGMSSEELDSFTTDEEVEDSGLTEEALEATGDSPSAEEPVSTEEKPVEEKPAEEAAPEKEAVPKKEPEPDPKDAVIGDFRRKNRDLEIEAADLRGELKARQTTTAVSKSPLELAMEAEGVDDPDELEKPYSVMVKQNAWEKEQDAIKTATTTEQTTKTGLQQAAADLQSGELSAEKMGVGLDLQSVARLAESHLTRGDLIDIEDIQKVRGHNAALKVAYKRAIARTLESGGEDAKLLQNAIKAKGKISQTKPKNETDIDALTTEGVEDTGEAETETPNSRLIDFLGGDGFLEG